MLTKFWYSRHRALGNQHGFTLIELMIVVAIIGILAAMAFLFYANVQTRAHNGKAQADTQTLATAVSIYTAHVGTLPAAREHSTGGSRGDEIHCRPVGPETTSEEADSAVLRDAGIPLKARCHSVATAGGRTWGFLRFSEVSRAVV